MSTPTTSPLAIAGAATAMTFVTPQPRELDARESDGIHVQLL